MLLTLEQVAVTMSPSTAIAALSLQVNTEAKDEAVRRTTPPYRPFFLAGIIFMLFAGAGWGVLLLAKFAINGHYTGFSLHELNGHGHAMISGFINLFIIGFAYQAFGGLLGHAIVWPRVRTSTFVLLVAGLVTSVAGQLLWPASAAWPLALIGDSAELLGVLLFSTQVLVSFRRGDAAHEPYLAFIFAAVGFLVVQSAFGLWLNAQTLAAESRMEVVYYVSRYQPALRDVQFHGTTLFMIIGVGHRLLTRFYNLPIAPNRTMWIALCLCTLGVFGEALLFIAFRQTGSTRLAAAMIVPWIALIVGTALVFGRWRPWRPMRDLVGRTDRMAKFVRASLIWLGVAWLMMIGLPLWSRCVADTYFSHAFYGAGRQAFSFGFVAMMIIAFSIRVVPNLNGIVPTRLRPMRDVFWLANIGCAAHVVLQSLSDLAPGSLRLLPAAGALEAIAIASWAIHLLSCMREGRRSATKSRVRSVGRTGIRLPVLERPVVG